MPRSTKTKSKAPKSGQSSLMVRLDAESKRLIAEAAALRSISVSDFVRLVTVSQARAEVKAASENIIKMTPEEQLAFWQALHEPVKLTPAQRRLGAIMRGEA